jgi:cytolysin (calcineurin-like family phosphatase)
MSIGIQFTNAAKIIASIDSRVKNIEQTLEATATGMGNLALNEIKPLCRVQSGNWRDSIHKEVKKLGSMKYELWVGSRGAFGAGGYNYGAKQERLHHPIEMGRQKAEAGMRDLFQKNITAGLGGKSITQNIASSNIDEFGSMAGF